MGATPLDVEAPGQFETPRQNVSASDYGSHNGGARVGDPGAGRRFAQHLWAERGCSIVTETGYAQAADGPQIAYAAAGSGPLHILGFQPLVPVELMWDEPRSARFFEGLSSFSRHVWFDSRGHGSSGSVPGGEGRIAESVTDDMLAVLNTLGEERTVALSFARPAPALLFAATYPSRTQALVLVDPSARLRADDGYAGLDNDQVEAVLAMIERDWGTGAVLRRFSGRESQDVQMQRWRAKCERLWFSPKEAVTVFRSTFEADLRGVLPAVTVPTLVLVTSGQPHPLRDQSLHVAEQIGGAKYLEISTDNYTQALLDAIEEFATGRLPVHDVDRVLATVLFTDIVDSTAQASRMGDRVWHDRLDAHDAMVRRHLARFRGREVKTTGDGFLATFDGPARAIRCGCAIRDEAAQMQLHVRAGVHTGEIELRGDDIGGVTVNIAARVSAIAGPGQVLVSRTVTDLVAGADLTFDDRGEHELKGVHGTWKLYAVEG